MFKFQGAALRLVRIVPTGYPEHVKIIPLVLSCVLLAVFGGGCVSKKEKAEQSLHYWQKKAALVTVGMKLSEAEDILPVWSGPSQKVLPGADELTAPMVSNGSVVPYELDKYWMVSIAYDKDERVRRPVEIERNTIMIGPSSARTGYPINLLR